MKSDRKQSVPVSPYENGREVRSRGKTLPFGMTGECAPGGSGGAVSPRFFNDLVSFPSRRRGVRGPGRLAWDSGTFRPGGVLAQLRAQ